MKTRDIARLIYSCLANLLFVGATFGQGDLNPAGPPGPTFKTLQQIEPRVPIDNTHTPGDANSIYKITSPGSYYLTGNITLAGRPGTILQHAIEVTSSGVTIDLCGFRIAGGGVNASLDGISCASNLKTITVKNGSIINCGHSGIQAGGVSCSSFSDLCLDSNNDSGLVAGDEVNVRNCRATSNGTNGIVVGSFSSIVECHARSNPKIGISAASRSIISKCSAGDTTSGDGIVGDSYCIVDHCTSYKAYSWGIRTLQRTLVTDCVVDSCGHPDQNGVSGGILLHFAGQVKNCTISGSLVGIEILGSSDGGGCLVANNQIDSNTGGGIDVLSGGNRIENNTFCCNGGPAIRTHEPGNFIVGNHAVGNNGAANDYVLGGNDVVGPVVTGKGNISTLTGGANPWANFQQ